MIEVCGKTMPLLPPMTGNRKHTSYKDDDLGMVYYCFTHILCIVIYIYIYMYIYISIESGKKHGDTHIYIYTYIYIRIYIYIYMNMIAYVLRYIFV